MKIKPREIRLYRSDNRVEIFSAASAPGSRPYLQLK